MVNEKMIDVLMWSKICNDKANLLSKLQGSGDHVNWLYKSEIKSLKECVDAFKAATDKLEELE